jgi:Bacterial membrane protein YfhO
LIRIAPVVRSLERSPLLGAGVLLGAVLAVFYAPVVFGGKSLQSPLYTISPVIPGGPWNYVGRRPSNTFDVDMATPAFYEWPLDRYIGRRLRAGELPLWNPHQGAGLPTVANYSTRAFFPFQALLDVSPLGLWDFFFLLRLWIAGIFTYCFLTLLGLGWVAAGFGALGYMLSGAFVWFINLEQYVNAAMMVPIWFWAVELLVQRPDPRRSALVALAVGFSLLAGQPEITFYTLVAGGLYGIARRVTCPALWGTHRRAIAWSTAAVLGGFAIAAAQLLPFAAHLPNALHLHRVGGDMGVRDPAPAFLAIQIFVPSFYELPTALRVMPDNGRWDLLGSYVGILAVFFTVAGLVVPPWREGASIRAPLVFFGAVSAWLLLKNFGIPPFDWIGRLPLFDQVWTPRWGGPTWTFALSVAAALGLHRLQETEMSPRARAWLALVAGATVLVISALAGIGVAVLTPVMKGYWLVWPGAVSGSLLALCLVGLGVLGFRRCRGATLGCVVLALLLIERWLPIPRGYLPPFLALRIVPIVLALLAVACLIRGRPKLAAGVSVLAVFLGLALDPLSPTGFPDRVDPAAPPPVVQFLRERAGYSRIMGDRQVLAPNYASVFGLYDVRHIDALSVEWFHGYVVDGLETRPRRWWHALWFVGSPERETASGAVSPLEEDLRARLRGYSLAGVRYLVVPKGVDLNRAATTAADRFPLVYDREVFVYENPAAFPRAFVVPRWESAPDVPTARRRALSPAFDPRSSATIEDGVAGAGGDGTVTIVEYGAARVRLSVDMVGPGLVVLTDTFYSGWSARVDGRTSRIHRVDGLFRGVFVDRGKHEITMRFLPAIQMWGLAISGGSILAAALGLAWPWRHR